MWEERRLLALPTSPRRFLNPKGIASLSPRVGLPQSKTLHDHLTPNQGSAFRRRVKVVGQLQLVGLESVDLFTCAVGDGDVSQRIFHTRSNRIIERPRSFRPAEHLRWFCDPTTPARGAVRSIALARSTSGLTRRCPRWPKFCRPGRTQQTRLL